MPPAAPSSNLDVPVALSLNELLAYHAQAFISCAYQTLLGRYPDAEGLNYYLGRLRTGRPKIQILGQLRRSKEGKAYAANLPRLDAAIRRYRWVQNPLISFIEKNEKYPLTKFLSTQRLVTALTGPRYARSREHIEIDITYVCNLKCFHCNRSCGAAPSGDRLSLEQIQKFLRESTAKGIQWERIRILGGEPTLHPDFLQILDELIAFKDSQCPAVAIEIVTNGFGEKVNDVIKKLSSIVVVHNTAKKSNKQNFIQFNLAPKDFMRYRYADYSSGCWVTQQCGTGLTPYGYYPCAVAGAIDRVFGFDIGRKSLPELGDGMRDQMEVLCRYCGFLTSITFMSNERNLISKSWRKAYKNYKFAKPRMTIY